MAIKYIKMADLRAMSDEELIRISCERNSRNKLSINAENACGSARSVQEALSGKAYLTMPPHSQSRNNCRNSVK